MKIEELEKIIEKYKGGQIEAINRSEHYLYRGEIEHIEIKKSEGKYELEALFKWLAEPIPFANYHWGTVEKKPYKVTLQIDEVKFYTADDIGEERIFLSPTQWFLNEEAVIYPPGYPSNIKKTEVY